MYKTNYLENLGVCLTKHFITQDTDQDGEKWRCIEESAPAAASLLQRWSSFARARDFSCNQANSNKSN
eukprot:747984-Amphidinium_carterae.1